ncbi:MFS transporter [Actinomadura sp. NBRC 104425]|uniref:CynX/NimT family MFS transporter n=1 Tax=Actinomadura sp. NBRC 104425 TaxID=3032204 RepID=UPI0024A513E0|nr:MFS transporter [Actinomadura sp. NBRC 104425]GLZ16393.1 MFS transporter [Actinomadura sp. NBRC 104425]
MTSTTRISRLTAIWTFIGLVLLTLNLRAAITGVTPLLGDLQKGVGLSGIEVSVLTTLPVLCLGVFAALAPPLARRFGTEIAITASLVLITAGILLRIVPVQAALFGGTVLAGAGIAMGNVLTPAVIKRVFPRRLGALTGMAMMLMAGSGALAAALAVPLNDTGGWRLALAVWAVPSLLAALAWMPLTRRTAGTAERPAPRARTSGGGSLLRVPLAWCVTLFMGLASLMFYVLMSWLPEIMRAQGYAPATAGMMVSVMMIIGIPLGMVVPMTAARMRDQRSLVVAVAVTMVVGLGGLIAVPQAGWLWVAVLGLGTGSAFPLAFTLLSLRAATPSVAARMSGMAQTGGYLLAGVGPLFVGVLHTATGGWHVPLGLLLALLVPEIVFGLLAARPSFVHDDAADPEPLTVSTSPAVSAPADVPVPSR